MNNKYFYCYSKPLKDYFVNNGLKYITMSIHKDTLKKFWVFEGNEKLNILLAKWRLQK